jgi:hypothetical protein
MVAGAIRDPALNPVAWIGLVEAGPGPATSNGLAEPWSGPVDDDSDRIALRAVDAAPRASSMAELQRMPRQARPNFHAEPSANAVPRKKACHAIVFRFPRIPLPGK